MAFPGLESPGKRPLVLKVLEICETQLKSMKCIEGSKENCH